MYIAINLLFTSKYIWRQKTRQSASVRAVYRPTDQPAISRSTNVAFGAKFFSGVTH